jgi:hypothetical protein
MKIEKTMFLQYLVCKKKDIPLNGEIQTLL